MADIKTKLNSKLLKAAGKGNVKDIEALLSQGADVNFQSGIFFKTPLSVAVWKGKTEAVKLLLDRGAKPDKRGISGFTPLEEIVYYNKPWTEIAKLLLAAGADPGTAHGDASQGDKSALENARENENAAFIGLLEAAVAEKTVREKSRAEKDAAERVAAERVVAERVVAERTVAAKAAEETAKAAAEAEKQKDMNFVTFRQQVLDRTIEETYNFEARERITFVRKAPGAPVEAVTRQAFSELAETPGLREAFREHRRRGGSADESTIFPDSLGKAKALHKPGGPDV